MAEILLFHHAHGLTPGFTAFADDLRDAGHVVHTPDLYEGRTFDDLEEGVVFAETTGWGTITDRGTRAADGLPGEMVYAGFSLGAMPAQKLAQTRAGACGALLFHSCAPAEEFGTPWPASVPLQIHTAEGDPWVELEVARALASEAQDGELFVYPGDKHLFADTTLPDYDETAASQLRQRVLAFLTRIA